VKRSERLNDPNCWGERHGKMLSRRPCTTTPCPLYILAAAMTILRKYEYLEPLALLELAVWKAECLKQMPSIHHGIFRAQQWIASGWKAHKTEQRSSNAMSIIIALVQPFLDPPVKTTKLAQRACNHSPLSTSYHGTIRFVCANCKSITYIALVSSDRDESQPRT
jgi:hypothetical protein